MNNLIVINKWLNNPTGNSQKAWPCINGINQMVNSMNILANIHLTLIRRFRTCCCINSAILPIWSVSTPVISRKNLSLSRPLPNRFPQWRQPRWNQPQRSLIIPRSEIWSSRVSTKRFSAYPGDHPNSWWPACQTAGSQRQHSCQGHHRSDIGTGHCETYPVGKIDKYTG